MIEQDLRKRYAFMREWAGGIVGENARCALELARAEQLLDRAIDAGVAAVLWEDEVDWSYGDLGDVYTEDEMRAKFQSNEWTGPAWCAIKVGHEVEASLGMIVLGPRGTDDPYARVVAAELASGIADQLRRTLDAIEGPAAIRALRRIHAILDGTEWSPDTLAEVADVVAAAGLEIRDPAEVAR